MPEFSPPKPRLLQIVDPTSALVLFTIAVDHKKNGNNIFRYTRMYIYIYVCYIYICIHYICIVYNIYIIIHKEYNI